MAATSGYTAPLRCEPGLRSELASGFQTSIGQDRAPRRPWRPTPASARSSLPACPMAPAIASARAGPHRCYSTAQWLAGHLPHDVGVKHDVGVLAHGAQNRSAKGDERDAQSEDATAPQVFQRSSSPSGPRHGEMTARLSSLQSVRNRHAITPSAIGTLFSAPVATSDVARRVSAH